MTAQTLLVGLNETDCALYFRENRDIMGDRNDVCAVWVGNPAPAWGHSFDRVVITPILLAKSEAVWPDVAIWAESYRRA